MGGCRHGLAAVMAAAVVVGMVLGACGASSPRATTSATVPATVASTAAADPYAVPATIDAAYLNRVFAALEHIDGDATRLIVANGKLFPAATDKLAAIYASDEFTAQTNVWLDLIDRGIAGFKRPPGDLITTVVRVLSVKASCLFVEVHRDYNAIRTEPEALSTEFISLEPRTSSAGPEAMNPTPWLISGEGYNKDGSTPADPCVGS